MNIYVLYMSIVSASGRFGTGPMPAGAGETRWSISSLNYHGITSKKILHREFSHQRDILTRIIVIRLNVLKKMKLSFRSWDRSSDASFRSFSQFSVEKEDDDEVLLRL